MKIAVFGLGYVGMVTAACLAHEGHEVVGVDVNARKVDQLTRGEATVHEPGLSEIVAESVRSGRLRATDSAKEAVDDSQVSLICVGTPSNANGSLDTRYVEKVCGEIGDALRGSDREHVVVIRSTVLPGTSRDRLLPLLLTRSGRSAAADVPADGAADSGAPGHDGPSGNTVGIAVNPEFLREGSAIHDFFHPSVVVVGADDACSAGMVGEMYGGIDAPVAEVSVPAAEMVKYVNNAFHALKITFANEVGALSKSNGVDGREVMEILTMDSRLNISGAYLRPGFAFGGSCLPKDMRALLHRAGQLDVSVPLLSSIPSSNEQHVSRAICAIESLGRRSVGVLGLSFKAGTDDVRESPSVPLIETLIGRGYEVSVFDDAVEPDRLFGANREYVERELPHIASIMRSSLGDVVDASDVVVVANGSPAFREVHAKMRSDQVLVDLVGAAAVQASPGGAACTSICW